MEKTVVFWRDVPIDVGNGDFEVFANMWQGKILVVSLKDFPQERKSCGYENKDYTNVEYLFLEQFSNFYAKAIEIIEKNYNAIHVFNGIRHKNKKFLDYLIKFTKSVGERPLIGVIGERPNVFGGKLKRIIRKIGYKIIYGRIAKKYNKYINCFFAMGIKGVEEYKKLGFDEESLFPYMYCPKLNLINKIKSSSEILRFLYIGRFSFETKGLDVLMKAFDKLPKNGWCLDLVGGYGESTQKVLKWCYSNKNVHFLGKWDNNDVVNKMSEYDVCVVPSRYDGWNLTPNQAICASVATIVSNEAVSDELIKYSGAGVVFNSGDYEQLQKYVLLTLENKEIVDSWKNKTLDYKNKITGESVGKYFYDVINYTFNDKNTKPVCPWAIEQK